MASDNRKLAVVTGASTGIGLVLAKCCSRNGFDLVVAADEAAEVAETGFKAMMKDEGDVVSLWHSKLRTAIASVTPSGMLAEAHRRMAGPGTAKG